MELLTGKKSRMTPKSSESEAREREVIRLCILYAGVPGSFVLSWLTYFDKHGADLRNLFTRDTFVTFAVNLLFFESELFQQISEWANVRWIILNLLVLLAGWLVIFTGITHWMASRGV